MEACVCHGIYAAGVQFDPVTIDGKTYEPSQANNFYIFPAVGMAIVATEAEHVPDEIFIAAAKATADQVTDEQLAKGMLFPEQADVQKVSHVTAVKSAEKIFELGLARIDKPESVDTLVTSLEYKPIYSE